MPYKSRRQYNKKKINSSPKTIITQIKRRDNNKWEEKKPHSKRTNIKKI